MKRNIRSAVTTAVLAGVGAFFLASDAAAQTTPAPQPSICNRACWTATNNGDPTQNSSLTHAIIHHTASTGHMNTTGLASSKANVRGVQSYHKSLGWLDIGYNFLVDKFGNIFEGRKHSISSRPRGAHDGVNVNSMGFNIMGYFHPPYNQQPPTAMRSALYDVIAWKMPSGWSPYGTATYGGATRRKVGGHRDVKATACPGDTMYNPYIGTNANGGEARNGIASRRTPSTGTTVTVGNTSSGFSASGNWGTATWCSDKHGADYRYRATAAVSDPATFTASLPSSGSWKVYAWWCVASDRASAAPYLIDHNGGTATVHRDQRANGGKWNLLGTYNINAGSRSVRLSCWTSSGNVVIADAVRWVK